MDTIIKTKEEAEDWFLSNSEGEVVIENPSGEQKLCGSFIEACEHLGVESE